jgi:hypothetical protein
MLMDHEARTIPRARGSGHGISPPPKTATFWVMVSANQSPEAGDMTDALEVLGFPQCSDAHRVIAVARPEFREYFHPDEVRAKIK